MRTPKSNITPWSQLVGQAPSPSSHSHLSRTICKARSQSSRKLSSRGSKYRSPKSRSSSSTHCRRPSFPASTLASWPVCSEIADPPPRRRLFGIRRTNAHSQSYPGANRGDRPLVSSFEIHAFSAKAFAPVAVESSVRELLEPEFLRRRISHCSGAPRAASRRRERLEALFVRRTAQARDDGVLRQQYQSTSEQKEHQ